MRTPNPVARVFHDTLSQVPAGAPQGSVRSIGGGVVRVVLPLARSGDLVVIARPVARGGDLLCEIVGVGGGDERDDAKQNLATLVPFGAPAGISCGDAVYNAPHSGVLTVDDSWIGRIVDSLGRPIDGGDAFDHRRGGALSLDRSPPLPMQRQPISVPMVTGVAAIDGLMTLGRGQRIGLFAGSGVGKSTLLGALARSAVADVVVVALVGERGREVKEFIDDALGEEGRRRSVVVVATGDVSAPERLRAARVATAIAEHYSEHGKHVLLLVDSITRFARAQREIGLAAGEPPTRRGYPPSVFSSLSRLLERAGCGARGAITAVYTVLVEGGDMDEPVADEVRGIVDGHIILDRGIATRGRYPAIDVVSSLSRVMRNVVKSSQVQDAAKLRALVALYEAKRDLLAMGAYRKGGDPQLDESVERMPAIEKFLQQDAFAFRSFDDTRDRLARLVAGL